MFLRASSNGQLQRTPRLWESRRPYASPTIRNDPHRSTLTQSQSQHLPTERFYRRTKAAFHHPGPLSRGTSADSRRGRDVVTDTTSRILNQDRGSGKTANITRRHRGTSTATEDFLNEVSRSPNTRRGRGSQVAELDVIANSQESPAVATALASVAAAEMTLANASRGFRTQLMLSQARKTIAKYKLVCFASGSKG